MTEQPNNVLVVEDSAEHVALLRQMLATAEGVAAFALHPVESLHEALNRLKRGGIDLILLDLTLPDSDGLETFIRMIEAAPDVPVVVMSGLADVALAVETVQLGAQDYLVKGHVDRHLLTRAMRYAVERKRVQRQLKRAYDELELRVQERTAALQAANARLQREIAERKKAEETANAMNQQLSDALSKLQASQEATIQRERMHALGRMANGIAHDFNNTLAPILGFSELLNLKPEIAEDPAKRRTYLAMIGKAAREAARVVSRLREFYRHRDESERLTPIVVNDLLEQVIAFTQPRWKGQAAAAGVQITMRFEPGDVPTFAGNEDELREALVNLIFNAADAIVQRGCITVRSEVQGRWLVITVSDDGMGMDEATRARCLEPFFTTKGEQGTGLGLGSVYGFVQRHEGTIDIQSTPGRGTSVALSLPIERGAPPPAAAPPPLQASRPLRILVAEDEPLVREVLEVYLAEDQHEVVMAENGRVALEKFAPGQFDVILTDRAMPEMNGDQFAAEVKRRAPGQKVILLTGFGDMMSGAGEKPEGVDLIVSKPFTLNMLREAIQQCAARAG
jgi:signal transduction histidine kinase